MSKLVEHVVVVLTVREAEQIASGTPDVRAWNSLRRKCVGALAEETRFTDVTTLKYRIATALITDIRL